MCVCVSAKRCVYDIQLSFVCLTTCVFRPTGRIVHSGVSKEQINSQKILYAIAATEKFRTQLFHVINVQHNKKYFGHLFHVGNRLVQHSMLKTLNKCTTLSLTRQVSMHVRTFHRDA